MLVQLLHTSEQVFDGHVDCPTGFKSVGAPAPARTSPSASVSCREKQKLWNFPRVEKNNHEKLAQTPTPKKRGVGEIFVSFTIFLHVGSIVANAIERENLGRGFPARIPAIDAACRQSSAASKTVASFFISSTDLCARVGYKIV